MATDGGGLSRAHLTLAIAIVAGPDFAGSVPVLQIQGAAILMTSAAVVGGFALLGMGAYRASLWCNLLGLVVVATVTAALVGPLGAEGAAVANVVGDLALVAAYLFAVSRRGVVMRWRIPAAAVVIAALLAAVALALHLPPIVEAIAAPCQVKRICHSSHSNIGLRRPRIINR